METLRYYLGEATHCRMQADVTACREMRESFLKLAEIWDELAAGRQWLLTHSPLKRRERHAGAG